MRTAISLIFFILISIFILPVHGQKVPPTDQEAVKILDRFSKVSMDAPSVSMKFRMVTFNQQENTSDTLNGSIILSKDKYKLELPDNQIWFNGDNAWNYLPAEKEVTITKADKKDNSFQNKPSAIFTMYKSGYKCRLIEEKADFYIIDLYPEDIKSDILRVRLIIGKAQLNLRNLEYKRRDGMVITLIVKEFNLKNKPDQDTFIFRPEKYKGVDVIDMR